MKLLAAGLTDFTFDRITLLSTAVGLIVLITVAVIVAFMLYRRKIRRIISSAGQSSPADTRPGNRTFAVLSEQAAEISRNIIQLSGLLTSINMRMTEFHRGFEQFTFGQWETHKQLQEKCQQLIRGLIVFRDRMEDLQTGRISPDKVATLAETCVVETGETLGQAGIVEISVKSGQPANPSVHSVVGMRNNEHPKGTILEVARRGYAIAGERGEFIPTRLAEIIISSGPAKQKAVAEEVNMHSTDSVVEENCKPKEAAPASSGPCEELPVKKDIQHDALGRQGKKWSKDNTRKDTKP